MNQIDIFNKKKQLILQSISRVCDIFNELRMTKEVQACVDIDRKLRKNNFKVVVVGEFKVGKSTFINAMLGSGDVLPAKATPCTAVINEIKYSKDRFAVIHFKHPIPSPLPTLASNIKRYIDGFNGKPVSPIKIKAEDLNKFVVIDDKAENQKEGVAQNPFAKAEIFWDLPLCEKGIEIIDSPGLNENLTRTDITTNYLSEADAVIFVFSADSPLSLTEMNFLQNDVCESGHQYSIFVCNKYDYIKEKERESYKKYIYAKLKDKTLLGEKGICFLSAEKAKNAREKGDEEALKESGMLEFEALLDGFLAKKRGTIKLLQPTMQLENMINTAIRDAIPNEEKMLSLSLTEFDRRLQRELPNLQLLKHKRDMLKIQVDNEIASISQHVEVKLRQRYQNIIGSMKNTVDGINCSSTISWNPFKVKESIKAYSEELIEKLQNELTANQQNWQKSEFEPFISNELNNLSNIFETSVNDILVEIERIKLRITGFDDSDVAETRERVLASLAGFLGGGIWGAAAGGTLGFSSEFIKTLAAQIAIGIVLGSLLGLTNPITLVTIAIAALIGIGNGIDKIKSTIRERITVQVVDQINNEKDESVSIAVKLFNEKLTQGSYTIYSAIDSEITSVEKLVESIKSDKEKGEEQVRQRSEKLKSYKSVLENININIQALIKSMENEDIEFTPWEGEKEQHSGDKPNQPVQQPIEEHKPDEPTVTPAINSEPDKPSPVKFAVEPGTEMFEREGVYYYRIDNCAHFDDNCNGDIYLGDNACCLCGKCGKICKIDGCKIVQNGNAYSVNFNASESNNALWMRFAGAIALKADTEWLIRLYSSIKDNK